METALLDTEFICAFRMEVGEEDFAEVADAFLEECETCVNDLPLDGDPETMASKFHYIRSSALNLGFSALAAHCATAEQAALAGNPDGSKVAEAKLLLRESKAAFSTLVRGDSADFRRIPTT